MNYVLLACLVAIAIYVVFWIDRKNKIERAQADSMYEFLFDIFDGVHWDMSVQDVREKFSDREIVTAEDFGDVMGFGYLDVHDEIEVFVSFFFPNDGEGRLIRTDIYLHSTPPEKYNLLFSKLMNVHGSPLIENGENAGVAVWELGDAILTFLSTGRNEVQLQFWNKDCYGNLTQPKAHL
ncbi:MAG: hypothetical protein IH874_08960 [Candidatus Dadabacteria bacterium]|nr:hypothetical protein [Candidatus Dadabacteria bacterium]